MEGSSFEDVRDALDYLNYNDRDEWVWAALCLKGEYGDQGRDLWMRWSANYEKFKQKDADNVWKSAKVSGKNSTVRIGSLFQRAIKNGYSPKTYSDAEKAKYREELKKREVRLRAERFEETRRVNKLMRMVAEVSATILNEHCKKIGKSTYLGVKKTQPCGALFVKKSFIILTVEGDKNTEPSVKIISGAAEVTRFYKEKTDDQSFIPVKVGNLIIPMLNRHGVVSNLQIIFKKAKLFLKGGPVSGMYGLLHRTGKQTADDGDVVICEGFATGASIAMATSATVMLAFNCHNLLATAENAKKIWPNSRILIAGDDDTETEGNPGKTKALAAGVAINANVVLPVFKEGGGKGKTDFNDLHVAEGLPAAKAQIEAGFIAPPIADDAFPPPPLQDEPPDYVTDVPPEGLPAPAPPLNISAPKLEELLQQYCFIIGDARIWNMRSCVFVKRAVFKDFIGVKVFKEWLESDQRRNVELSAILPLVKSKPPKRVEGLGAALSRYVYLNPTQEVWDTVDRKVVAIAGLKCAIANCYPDWIKDPRRKEIRAVDLVFDPTQRCAEHCINRFKGLPLVPVFNINKCDYIYKMLKALTVEGDNDVAFDWILKWLAYPLQNVGAKMRSAVLMHSDHQGSGKSYFFDNIMRAIYGEYAAVVGQAEMDSPYNDWTSETLWAVFEEVFTRANKYSSMGTVKQLITGAIIRVNQKFLSGWEESNHLNCVYLSNEVQPFPIEPHDRRFLIIWPERKLIDELRDGVKNELANGGAEAFLGLLLGVDLTGFDEFTEPPMTEAKQRIIDFGRPAWETFYVEWQSGELDYPFINVRVGDLFKLHQTWCRQRNEHCLSQSKFTGFIRSRGEVVRRKGVWFDHGITHGKGTFFQVGNCPEGMNQGQWYGECVQTWEEQARKDKLERMETDMPDYLPHSASS